MKTKSIEVFQDKREKVYTAYSHLFYWGPALRLKPSR